MTKLTSVKVEYLKEDRVLISGKKGKKTLKFEMTAHSFEHLCKAWNLTEKQCAEKMLLKKAPNPKVECA